MPMLPQRKTEFGHLHEVSLQADTKMAEIMCAKKMQHRQLLCSFLSTKVWGQEARAHPGGPFNGKPISRHLCILCC